MQKKCFYLISLITLLFSIQTFAADALPCDLTVTKTPEWNNFDIVVTMIDSMTKKPVLSFDLKAASGEQKSINSVTESFTCKDHPMFTFTATITPAVWSNEKGKTFYANQNWDVSGQILSPPKDTIKVVLKANFPENFAQIPSPVI